MRISKQVPETKLHTVERKKATSTKPGWYEVYLLEPVMLGEMTFDGLRTWTTDDGLEFAGMFDVEKYYKNRINMAGRPLEPGRYSANIKSVKDDGDRVVIKTTDGDIVIARSK